MHSTSSYWAPAVCQGLGLGDEQARESPAFRKASILLGEADHTQINQWTYVGSQ